MSEHISGRTLLRRPGSATKPLGSPAPLRDLGAGAVPRRGLHRAGQMPGLARIRRRTRTPEHTLAPPLRRLPTSLFFLANLSLRALPSAKISRRRGGPPRPYPRPRPPQRPYFSPPIYPFAPSPRPKFLDGGGVPLAATIGLGHPNSNSDSQSLID